jgi:hypothetical protein
MNPHRPSFVQIGIMHLASLLPITNDLLVSPAEDTDDDVAFSIGSLAEEILEYLQSVTRARNVKALLIQKDHDEEVSTQLMVGLVTCAMGMSKITAAQVSCRSVFPEYDCRG